MGIISGTTTIRAVAVKDGLAASQVAEVTFNIVGQVSPSDRRQPLLHPSPLHHPASQLPLPPCHVVTMQVAAPTLLPDRTVFTMSATLVVECQTPDALILYTTDGSFPTTGNAMSVRIGDTIFWGKTG